MRVKARLSVRIGMIGIAIGEVGLFVGIRSVQYLYTRIGDVVIADRQAFNRGGGFFDLFS